MAYLGPYIPEDYEIEAMFANLSLAKGIITYNSTNVMIGDALPSNSILVALAIKVSTAWDVSASLTIGSNSSSTEYTLADSIDLSQVGVYMIDVYRTTIGPTSLNAYLNAPGANAGEATVFAIIQLGA